MVWHGAAWLVILALWGLWSLVCWLAQSVIGWDGWQRGGDWAAHVPDIALPEWLSAWLGLGWVEALRDALREWGPTLQAWMASWPDLGAWASGLVWVVWGVGTLALGLAGLALSALIALVRRTQGGAAAARG